MAWASLERTWSATLERVAGMPADTVDVPVDGEWSFAQTLRHLIFATDMWLGRGILELEQPFHPMGQLDDGTAQDGDPSTPVAMPDRPAYTDVLEVRAERLTMVREFIAGLTPEELATTRQNPHEPEYPETTLSCLHVILEEEWEHHRYAVRDLDSIAAQSPQSAQPRSA